MILPNLDKYLGMSPLGIQPKKHITAGEKSLEASKDFTKYDGREVAEAQMWDIVPQLLEAARAKRDSFDEPFYYVIMQRASDPLLSNLVRQKYYCDLYMPSPRPEQAVFEYRKADDSLKFLWSLPPAKVMAALAEAPKSYVSYQWKRTKTWVDAFYKLKFWECIREMYGNHHISMQEFLNANREEIKNASGNQLDPSFSESLDLTKIGAS